MTEREEKQLERIHEKLEYMKSKKREILKRDRKRKREERKRHLTKCGELAEQYFEFEEIHPVEFEKFLQILFLRKGAKEVFQYVKKSLH